MKVIWCQGGKAMGGVVRDDVNISVEFGEDKVLAFVFCMHGLHMDWELERMFLVL